MVRLVWTRRFTFPIFEWSTVPQLLRQVSLHTSFPSEARKDVRNAEDLKGRRIIGLNFSENVSALSSIPTREVVRAWFVYQLFRSDYLVDKSEMLMNLSRKLLGETLFKRIMKATVYGQFVGGEDIPELKKVIENLKANGIYPVLDYAVEKDIPDSEEVSLEKRERSPGSVNSAGTQGRNSPKFKSTTVKARVIKRATARTHFYVGEEECDSNMENFLLSLKAAAECSVGTTAFVAVKLTALGRPQFLLELAEVLTNTRRTFHSISSSPLPASRSPSSASPDDSLSLLLTPEDLATWLGKLGVSCSTATIQSLYREMDLDGSGHVDIFDWLRFFAPGRKPHEFFAPLTEKVSFLYLSEDGELQMKNMLSRTHTIAESASALGVRMMVDAEQTYYQPGIRHIAVNVLMPKYNNALPVVYNTIQSYLKESPTVIEEDIALSKQRRFYYGVKLVRGAYMEQERQRAVEMDYPSPIHDTKEETDRCYNRNISRLLCEAQRSPVYLMVASHNETSANHAVSEMSRYDIPPHDGTVTFGQLYGMCDHVSLTLGQSGYEVYKYLPYGPISEVMPYLIRRANENRGMMKGADRYRRLVSRELQRRLKSRFVTRNTSRSVNRS